MASYAIVYNGISGSREVSLVIMCAVIRVASQPCSQFAEVTSV